MYNFVQNTGSSWVVQKYIENPLLINNRKFDIRAYALVTPDSQVYFYKDSYVRTASVEFDASNLDDRAIHLTNDAIQCKYGHYNSFEDHNKLTMEELQKIIGDEYDINNVVFPKMKEIVRHVFKASLPRLNPKHLDYCFELFGLDFMLDTTGSVFLIEINTGPALQRHGKVLEELMPKVIEEVVQKAVDPFFPPPPGETLTEPTLEQFELLNLAEDPERVVGKQLSSSSTLRRP